MSERLRVYFLGRVEYGQALALQERVHGRCVAGGPDTLLLLEHPPVYTLGRAGRADHLGRALASGVPVFRVGRGGDATYHGPGQLVGYPVLRLRGARVDLHGYLRALEQGLAAAAGRLGVRASTRSGLVGVWAGRRKLASIGIGVRRGVTMHGFALNVGPDLAPFRAIVPCGLHGIEMTSVSLELGRLVALEEVIEPAGSCVAEALGYGEVLRAGGLRALAAELAGAAGGPAPAPSSPRLAAGAMAS